ncbi:MAG: glycosyltransferase family 39 protein, partial [Candidatus Eisenbacteria bacterium]
MTGLPPTTLVQKLSTPRAILVFAALLRLALVGVLGNQTFWADTKEYEATALQFLSGHGAQAGNPRAPVYPLFMALGFRLGGIGNYLAIRLLQLVPAVLLVHVSGQLARRIAGGTAQRLTMLALAVSPTVVFTSGMLYPTTIYSLILVSATLGAWELADRPNMRSGVLLGLGVGAGWLTDQVFIAPAAAMLLWLILGLQRVGIPLA